jgi:uncharacterized damage-inducible protein DinB
LGVATFAGNLATRPPERAFTKPQQKQRAVEFLRRAQYTSRPNEAEMTFGEQMIHIANAIVSLTKGYAPKAYPTFDPKKTDKETAIADLKSAFSDGAAAIGSLSDATIGTKIVGTPEGKMTAFEAVLLAFDHTEHHRGQAIVYLRYKNIKPVDYVF